jgi:hypothetical protein
MMGPRRVPDERPTFKECFGFPVGSPEARRDVLVGGALLLLGPVGWVLNLGQRLDVVQRLYRADPPYFRGFAPWTRTFARGLKAVCAIAVYLAPAALLGGAGAWLWWRAAAPRTAAALWSTAAAAFAWAVFSLPGGMTYNAAFGDVSYLYRPDKAFRRALAGGRAYLWAWLIGGGAVALSLAGLLAGGVGFLWTSVWAWTVVGYAFSRALVLPRRPRPPAAGGPASGAGAARTGA